INVIFSNNLSLLVAYDRSMRMPPGAADVGVREDYELRDGASPSALERCAISAVMHVRSCSVPAGWCCADQAILPRSRLGALLGRRLSNGFPGVRQARAAGGLRCWGPMAGALGQ